MRVRVGVIVASLTASILAFGTPAGADETSTSAPTSVAASTDPASGPTTTGPATSPAPDSTVADPPTATTVAETTTPPSTDTATTAAATTVPECPDPAATTTTVADPTTTTTTPPDCPPATTDPPDTTAPDTTAPDTTGPDTGAPDTTAPGTTAPDTTAGPAIDVAAAPSPASGGPAIAPAQPGQGPPIRGTQAATRPIPPKPTTTTTTTTTTLPTFGLPANSGSGRRVVYSKSQQRVWVVDWSGRVIKTHLVSGRQTPLDPRPGHYRVWSRSRHTFSISNPSITWGFMVRFAWGARGGNIGFHEIPFQYGRPVQSIWQLGQPLSGGCVRQARPDAIWMWNWAQIGTRVVVLG